MTLHLNGVESGCLSVYNTEYHSINAFSKSLQFH